LNKILEKIQNGSDESDKIAGHNIDQFVESIYDEYHSRLERYVNRRVKSKFDREEVIQGVYLRLMQYKNLKELKPSLAFLCVIASNILKDQNKRNWTHKVNNHVPMEIVDLASPNPSPEQMLHSKECIAEFTKFYETLKPKARMAFSLHRFKGHTYEEIATEMGISYNMVKKHISNVLVQIRKKYGELI